MTHTTRLGVLLLLLAVPVGLASTPRAPQDDEAARPAEDDQKRPSLSVRVRPQTGIAPVEITATAELSGGSDNFREYYCAAIEWEWGDGATSQSEEDCEPYDVASSTIDRRHTARHTYRYGGNYRVTFRLRQRDDVVAFATSQLRLTGGFGPGPG